MATFQLDIVTPEKLVLSQAVTMVTLPAVDGQIGLLKDHAPIITALEQGEVTLYLEGGAPKVVTITGGVVEMLKDKCVVLAEQAEV
jgi:F-type H+-transporting ATPase subunit epsilon